MTRDYFIRMTSKIDQTFEDEFQSKFNSPECMWDNFLFDELFEFMNFIRNNYSRLGDEFVRNKDEKIIYDNHSILEDFANYRLSL